MISLLLEKKVGIQAFLQIAQAPTLLFDKFQNILIANAGVCVRTPRTLSDTSGAVVYRIPCRECDEVYIGQTGRDFKVRLGEHKTAVRHGLEWSAVLKLVYEHNHVIDWGSSVKVYHSPIKIRARQMGRSR